MEPWRPDRAGEAVDALADAYEITNHERVSDDLETWIFFRKNDALDQKENER